MERCRPPAPAAAAAPALGPAHASRRRFRPRQGRLRAAVGTAHPTGPAHTCACPVCSPGAAGEAPAELALAAAALSGVAGAASCAGRLLLPRSRERRRPARGSAVSKSKRSGERAPRALRRVAPSGEGASARGGIPSRRPPGGAR